MTFCPYVCRLACFIFILPCSSLAQPEPTEKAETKISTEPRVSRDDFIKTTFLYGRTYLSQTYDETSSTITVYGLEGTRKDGGKVHYYFSIDIGKQELVTPIHYPKWKKAVDADGTEFTLIEEERSGDRSVHQPVYFEVTRDYMEMVVARTVMKYRFYGKGQNMDFSLPNKLVEEFLQIADKTYAEK